jgi:beta-glucanase (GH16 family)
MRIVSTAGSRSAAAAALALALACGLMPPEQPKSAPAPAPPPPAPVALPPAGYQLVWEDDFQGSSLDSSKWTALVGPRRDAHLVADAASVSGGVLTITTYTQAGQHRTAFLTTQGNFQPTYGYVEARILFQDAPGEWCSFWLESPTNGNPMGDPATAGVEIDVVEHRVTDQGGWTALANMVALNLNWDGYGTQRKNAQSVVALPDGSPVQGSWHTYGVLWTDTGYTFYVDGVQLWATTQAISRRSEFIQLTCEVQDASWAGSVPPGGYGSRDASTTGMRVDWVRVWQKPP